MESMGIGEVVSNMGFQEWVSRNLAGGEQDEDTNGRRNWVCKSKCVYPYNRIIFGNEK